MDISKWLRLAIILLVALLLISVQQDTLRHLISASITKAKTVDSQLSFQQGNDSASSPSIVHNDTQFVLISCLALACLLLLFLPDQNLKTKVFAPAILSRNSCYIIPKGP